MAFGRRRSRQPCACAAWEGRGFVVLACEFRLTGGARGVSIGGMDDTTRANRAAWEAASVKHVREYDDLLAQTASGCSLTQVERHLLAPVLREAPEVVHLQSGHGLDDVALVRAAAGLQIVHLSEYAEPFWRMGGVSAAAWNGRLPNAYALLARLPG
jgi:hypothetical protein